MSKETTYYIYVLIDPRTHEERYVGQTNNIKRRQNSHKYTKNGKTPCKDWIRKLKSLDMLPIMRIIDVAENKEEANRLETYHIYWRRKMQISILNLTSGGEGTIGYHPTESIIEKQRMRQSGQGNPMYGRKGPDHPKFGLHHSEETKHKQSLALKGNPKVNNKGEHNPRAKLNEEKVRSIKKRLAAGVSGSDLAKEHNVNKNTISRIKTSRNWGWVE